MPADEEAQIWGGTFAAGKSLVDEKPPSPPSPKSSTDIPHPRNSMLVAPDTLHQTMHTTGGDMPSQGTVLAALTVVMPPHDGADEQVDWDAIRRAWGVGFPSDYIAFMSTYGAGGIGGALSVVTPEASTQPADSPDLGGMAAETANMRHMWESEGGPDEVDGGPDSVVAWGVSCGADILGWLTVDHDPNKWPVVVWERHGWPHWKIYDCGMAEFLRRLFTNGFDECPLSDLSLWGEPSPHFVHWREERRRWESGVDPYTGEPDPYFGMKFD